jgi:cytochrome c2
MPDFEMADDEIESLVAFLWAQPPAENQVVAVREYEQGDYDRGRKVFRQSMCISCHVVEGKGNGSASELSGIGSKVNRDWLFAFLLDPHAFQPESAMPHYAFEHGDLVDLTQFMMEEFVDPSAPEPGAQPYRPAVREVQRGETVYAKYGCGGCHHLQGHGEGVRIGPELISIGDRAVGLLDFGQRFDLPRTLPAWLAAKLVDPRSFRPGLKMPAFDIKPEEVQAVVTALLASSADHLPDTYRVAAAAREYDPPGAFGRLVERYRCQSCHLIQGTGADIATAPLTHQGSKVKRQWLEDYMLVPTTIRPLLTERMPPLRMSREEATVITDFIQNVYVDDAIQQALFPDGPPPERVERGRGLFRERYGCGACHMVDNQGGYYGPLLNGLGDRLEPGWIAWWLQGPQRWREDVRCPDYALNQTDAEDLAAFVASISAPLSSAEGTE